MQINNMYNAPLGKEIQKSYATLCTAIENIPAHSYAKKIIDFTEGPVSVSDIVAYQIGWGTLLIGWYIAGQKNEMPIMPGDGFTSWDYGALARHFYVKYQYGDKQKQLQKFEDIVQAIIMIVEKEHNAGNLDTCGVWQWCTLASGKQWPLSKWVQVNTIAPYKRATKIIKKSFNS